MLQTVATLVGLIALVPFVMTLIKLFKEKGALHGILGLICGLYTFIWGWMNVKRHNSMGLMTAWTALWIVSIVLNAIAVSQASAEMGGY